MIGFTSDTEIWCSVGCYKTIEELKDIKGIIVDSFNTNDKEFINNWRVKSLHHLKSQ